MSRQRQRMCLAQRGTRRNGRQKDLVRNYVAEMANNLWATKYPSFGRLDDDVQKRYWAKIFGSYKTKREAKIASDAYWKSVGGCPAKLNFPVSSFFSPYFLRKG